MFRSLGKALVALVPAVQLGRLGLPMIVALFTLTVLSLAALCWVISDDGRSERLTMIIMARAAAAADPADPANGG
jgi:hypothetical protein